MFLVHEHLGRSNNLSSLQFSCTYVLRYDFSVIAECDALVYWFDFVAHYHYIQFKVQLYFNFTLILAPPPKKKHHFFQFSSVQFSIQSSVQPSRAPSRRGATELIIKPCPLTAQVVLLV